MFECLCFLDNQIKVRPTGCNKWWFSGSHLFLNASLHPSSGEQTASHCLQCSVLAVAVVVPERRVARCVHCENDVAWSRFSRTTTATAGTEHRRQWLAVCCPDDGCKDAQNMLRNKWLPINHNLLHVVGFTFICLNIRSLGDQRITNQNIHIQTGSVTFSVAGNWGGFMPV